jgi:radical SAM protein with 4Fe4S-binding SPASM domain
MILRYEPWGAWAKLESPAALVALDRDAVRAIGLDGGAAWSGSSAPSAPIEVHLAVTSRCAAGCTGCYLDARPDGHEPARQTLLGELDALARAGVFTVAFGGGEPTTREDIGDLADDARARGISPVLTTSGLGLTAEKAARLRSFAQVNVSYDGASAAYEAVRGFDGARHAEAAIEALARAGVPVGVNVVLTRATFGALEATLERARSLGAREAQLLRYKPAGRAASLDYLARRLTPEQGMALGPLLRRLATQPSGGADTGFRIRIDCALVPFLSADPTIDAATLARFGVLGCEAGDALVAVRVDGRVAPCSFAEPTLSVAGDLAKREHTDPEIARWRAWNASPPEPCASCALRSVCRGGCKVVARHLEGAHGSDPECPRVRAHRAPYAPKGTPTDGTTTGSGESATPNASSTPS